MSIERRTRATLPDGSWTVKPSVREDFHADAAVGACVEAPTADAGCMNWGSSSFGIYVLLVLVTIR
jgi:hypothetical protein